MPRLTWFAGLMIGVVVALVVLVFYGAKPFGDRSGETGAVILVGHVAPLTGDAAVWGVWEREGIDLAVDGINAAGGVAGRRLAVIHEDDQGAPARAVSALQNLITIRRVRAVIGGTLSGTTLAMAPIAMRNKVVLISPSAQSPRIAEAGDYIFRLFVPTTLEGAFLAELVNRSEAETAAILYLDNDFGVGLKDAVTAGLNQRINIVASEAYSGDTRDFRAQIQRLTVSQAPDALFLLGYQADVATILKQLSERGVRTQVYAPNSFEGEETVSIAGSAAEGVIYDYPVLPDSELTERVQAAFRDRYGRDMNVYNGVGYDAMMLIAHAMNDEEATTSEQSGATLRDAMRRVRDFPGVTGPITFGGSSDVVNRPLEARTYRGGKFEPLR